MTDTYFFFFGIIVNLVGVAMLVAYFRNIILCKATTYGTITKLHKEKLILRGSTVYSYQPEFEYEFEGQKYTGIGSQSSYRKSAFKVGEQVKVRVNPNAPEQYHCKESVGILIAGIVLFALGGLFAILYLI